MGDLKRIMLVFSDEDTALLLERIIRSLDNFQVIVARACKEARRVMETVRPDLLILGDKLEDGDYTELASQLVERQPTLPIILLTSKETDSLPRETIRLGLVDWLSPPLTTDIVREAVERGLQRSQQWQEWLQFDSSRYTGPLLERVDELETISEVGQTVTAQLDLDGVLTTIVDAAVKLTGAEEGSILLQDEDTEELYMLAARNFQEDFVRTFRLPVEDTHAGEVIKTGEPVIINADDPQKIKTAYLVHSLVYVPLICSGRTIGVLGVDNRESGEGFSEKHVTLISTLADYAAIAIENAKLYSETEVERNKLENILTQIEDGVIVVGESNELILVNRRARLAFNLGDADLSGKTLEEVFDNRDLLRAIRGEALDPQRIELKADDAHFYRVQVTNIQDIGTVATLQDISYLKELDRIKTDFVTTVSHDLRSPLTSILGYVELIKRAGLVNENQEDYIQRVQMSVHSITSLISELLDLGRIEVGLFDEFELVSLSPILEESLNGLQPRLIELKQNLTHDIPDKLPNVYGDPIQLRQLLDNLIGNAIKYTQNGGEIKVTGTEEDNKVIIRVADNGRGIPLEEQANIFDRFFRASNVPDSSTGTGLGLAITKSIVENHRGRIWVDSTLGKGSVFTVVLPTSKT